MKKKSQIAGQIFIWILAIFILAIIVFYGYKAISSFMQKGEEVSFIQFKNTLESEVTRLSTQLGDVVVFNERNPLNVPGKYKTVCFVSGGADDLDIPIGLSESLKKTINASIESDIITTTENVFLEPLSPNPIYVGNIEIVDGDILCMDVVNGRIDIRLTGRGGATRIERIE